MNPVLLYTRKIQKYYAILPTVTPKDKKKLEDAAKEWAKERLNLEDYFDFTLERLIPYCEEHKHNYPGPFLVFTDVSKAYYLEYLKLKDGYMPYEDTQEQRLNIALDKETWLVSQLLERLKAGEMLTDDDLFDELLSMLPDTEEILIWFEVREDPTGYRQLKKLTLEYFSIFPKYAGATGCKEYADLIALEQENMDKRKRKQAELKKLGKSLKKRRRRHARF